MSYLTKKKIANQGRELIIQNGVEHTNVTNIMKNLQMRRQTFYDYFADKYELIEWLYNDEITEVIESNLNYDSWPNIISSVCQYIDQNRNFYNNIVTNYLDDSEIKFTVDVHVKRLVETIVKDILLCENIDFDSSQMEFTKNLFANSLYYELKSWVISSNPRPCAEEAKFLYLFISDTINGMLFRKKLHPTPKKLIPICTKRA